jgi:hypothetical protein
VDKGELMIGVLERYDVRYADHRSGWQSVRCPNEYGHAHGDENPSARLNLTLGLMTCMGCDLNGDGYNVVMSIENVGFKEALELAGKVEREEESDWLF